MKSRPVLLLFYLATVSGLSSMVLDFSPTTISTVATYEISFLFDTTILANSIVKITFPSEVTITDSTSVSCTISSQIYNPDSSGVSCSVSSRVFTVNGAFGTDSSEIDPVSIPITVTLPSITNPSTTQTTSAIEIAIYSSSGSLLESTSGSTDLKITASAAYFSSASITPTSSTIGELTTWTFSVESSFTVPSSSSIQITFPYWNSYIGASTTTDYLHFIRVTSPSATSVSNIDSPLSTSYSSSSLILTVSSGFTSSKTGTISWQVSSVYNPPTSDSLQQFSITIYDSNSKPFLTTQSKIAVQVSSANTITLRSTAFSASNRTVSTSTTGFISFTLTNPTYSGVTVEVTFPSDIAVSSAAVVTGVSNIATSGLSYTISSNVIKITNGWSAYSYKTSVSIRVDPITTASSTLTSGDFTVSTRSPNGNLIDTGTGGSTTARVGTIYQYLSNSLVTALDLTVGSSTTYIFDMWLSHTVSSGGALIIQFPSEISITSRDSSTACTSVVTGLNSAAKCQVVSRTLTVIGGFPSSFSSGRVSFTINGVTNPSTTATTSTFTYYSATDSTGSYQIDSLSTGITFTAAVASLVSASAAPSSYTTGETATYTFEVVTKNTIPSNGYLKVTFPSELSFSSSSSAASSCSGVTGFTSSVTCTISSQVLTVFGFSSGQFTAGTLQWTVGYVSNTYSTAPSSSFVIGSYDSSGNAIDQKSSGITVTLTTANTFSSFTVTPSSYVNGNTGTYTISAQLKNITPSGSYIILTAPSTVTLPSTPSCAVVSGITAVSCSYESSTSIRAVLTNSATISAGSTVSFTISSVKSPGTTKPTSSFTAFSYTSTGYSIEKKETGITLATTTAATISTISISADDPKISVSTAYTISYLPVNTHASGTVLFITIPSEFTIGTISCSKVSSSLSESMTCLVNGREITVNSAFSSDVAAASTVSIKLSGFTNPTSQLTTSAWVVASVTSDNYLIDRSSTVTSSFTCDSVCLTCITLSSTCTSCSSTSGYPYLYDSSCYSTCKDGYTDDTSDTDKVCVQCNSLCKTCSGSIATCTSCDTTSGYPYLHSSTCNAKCLTGYWGNGSECKICTNPCATCSSDTYCITCGTSSITEKQTYLLSGVCYTTCPDGYTSYSTDNTCVACTGLCSTCSTSSSTCTSCQSPYKLQGTICVSKCIADGTYIETDTACSPCISPCYTCSGDTTSCTTCVSTYYLYSTSCTQTCPPKYVGISSKCRACTSPCEECSGSQSTCTSCIENYYLQVTSCVDKCSSGYYLDGVTCTKCDSSCASCSGGSTLCTSCTNPKYLYSSTCVSSCPAGTYVPTTGLCNACESPCATCSGNIYNCQTCSTGMYLSSGTCVSECTSGTTVLVGSECETCNTNCKTCSGTVDTCTSCDTGFYLEDGKCVDSCSFGYILVSEKCAECNSACFTCSETTSNCTSCVAGQYIYETTCVSTCPQNYVASGKNCVEIIDSGDCTSGCNASLLNNEDCDNVCNVYACAYDNGYCNMSEITCGSGKYLSGSICYACSNPCSNCLSTANTCTSCQAETGTGNQLYLYNNKCYSECPDKTYQSGITCVDCGIRCATCALSSSTCTSCVSPYKIYNNQCVVNCPSSTSIQLDSNTCSDCSSNCKYCSVTFDNCTACDDPLVLQGSSCVSYCNSGYFSNNGVCQACSGCKECSGTSTTCTSCTGSKLVYSGTCVSSCPVGTYASTLTCEACSSACFSCSEASSCDTCPTGSYLYLTACVSACPSGYVDSYGICVLESSTSPCSTGCTETLLSNGECDTLCDLQACNYDNLDCGTYGTCGSGMYSQDSTCYDCVYPCKQCTTETSCRSCQVSVSTGKLLLLDGTDCVEPDDCTDGYTQVGVYCKACDSSCKTCSGSTTTCISCESGQYLYNGACVSTCPSLITVVYNSVCLTCASSCATCSGTYDKCSSCPSGKVLQGTSCTSSCSSGYTVTTSIPSTCQACTGDCSTCSDQTYLCTSCKNSKYLSGTSCISKCPDSTTITSGYTCEACESPCMTCESSITQCTLCISGYSLFETSCVASCPSGYESRLGVCTAYCAEGCTVSLLYNSACDSVCNVDACLYDNTLCETTSSCAAGKYLDLSECVDCVDPCNTCSSETVCSSCIVNSDKVQLLLYDGGCYVSCPSGTYKIGIQCKDCDSSCEECSKSATTCTSCPTGKKLYNGACKSSCPVATTVEVSGICYDCDDNCEECSGTVTTCSKCLSGAVLSGGTCTPECADGYTTTDTSDGECVACNGCKTCLGSESYCTSCSTGEVLHQNLCYSSCPSGYTNTTTYPNTCTACSSDCAECMTKIDYCISCANEKVLNSYNKCQVAATCPDGQTTTPSSLSTCQDCQSPCVNCKDSATYCTSCADGEFVNSGTCSTCSSNCKTCTGTLTYCVSCADGSYLTSKNICESCSASCLTCSGTASTCKSCKSGLYLSGNSCLECDSNCGECEGTPTECTACDVGYYLTGTTCSACNSNCYTCDVLPANCTSCASGKYVNSARVCVSCSSTCKECEGSSTLCTECNSPQVLVNDKCGTCNSSCATCVDDFNTCGSCSSQFTLINGICAKCTNNCKTCAGSFSSCTSCLDSYFLSGANCFSCSSNCDTCSGTSTTCTSCLTGKSLIGTICEVCDSPCLTCSTTKSNCVSCDTGKYLSSGTCYSCDSKCTKCFSSSTTCEECTDGYYLSGNTCMECSNLCVTCKTTSTYCTSCISEATLKNGVCVLDCNSGYMQIGLGCEPCSPSCKTCSGAVDQCTSCSSGIVYENTCVDHCPVGYYVSNGGCQPCSTNCYECYKSSTTCITCNDGYKLVGTVCEYVCLPGEFSNGGVCQPCDESCNTCYGTSIKCTSCSNSTYILMDDGVCVEACDSGYIRLKSSEPCIPCSTDCKECSSSVDYCTSCSSNNMYNYLGKCIPSCPENTTVPISKKCVECSDTCIFCESSPYTCTLCPNDTYLYITTCVEDCPVGYRLDDIKCEKCYNPNNCSEIEPSSSSNTNISSTSSTTSHEFEAKPVPFPFSGVSIVTAGLVGITKLTSAGVHFVPSTIAVWGSISFTSWVFLAGYVPDQGDSGNYRRLADVASVGGNAVLTVSFFLIIGALMFHFVCNLLFSIKYTTKVLKKDRTYKYWKKSHRKVNMAVLVLSYVVSFHCIRFLFCGMCNYDGFQATYDNKSKVYKPLIKYGYISILCTFVPIFIAEILILSVLDVWYWLWMFTLDSLFLTFLLALLIIVDIKRRERELLRLELEKELGPLPLEGEELMKPSNSVKDLIDMFPQLDFTSLIPQAPLIKRQIKKLISVSKEQSPVTSPRGKLLKRSASFPLLKNEEVEIRPEDLRPPEKPIMQDEEPFGEEILNKSEENEDLTMIVEEVPEILPEEPKEFEVSFTEYKDPVSRPTTLKYSPIEIEHNIQEFTEVIAYTEEDEPSEEEKLPTIEEEKIIPVEESKLVEEFEVENIAEPPKMSKENLLEEPSSDSEDKPQILKDLGSVSEEHEIDLDKALADPKDPELIKVFHKQSGQHVTIRKGFKGARIVDLENKIIESLPPVDPKKFESGKTVVDESDVRFATMTAKTGERVRVKRSFKGARIVDLEKKVNHPHAYLIGQAVNNENDFQFSNAYPDPDDPEVVVVMHNETGEDVKIRKTFQGAQIVDEAGEPIQNVPGIDRNDYDIPRAIVDKDDVHLATLKHRVTNQKVKVRRTFRGAKIIDLERKVEFPKALPVLSEKSDEPEPLSPSLSDNDILGGDMGWITPAEIKKKSPKLSLKKPPLKPIAVTPKVDETYDRRKLANLANLIDDLEEESKDWQQPDAYRFISESSEEDLGFKPQRKNLYHNVDLDSVYAPEFKDDFEPDEFPTIEKKKPRKKKKRTKKIPNADPVRMKGLEDIYLQRLEGKKKALGPTPMKYTGEGGFEPEWERTDSAHDFRFTGTLPSAGEEIINPRFKVSTPRRDFK